MGQGGRERERDVRSLRASLDSAGGTLRITQLRSAGLLLAKANEDALLLELLCIGLNSVVFHRWRNGRMEQIDFQSRKLKLSTFLLKIRCYINAKLYIYIKCTLKNMIKVKVYPGIKFLGNGPILSAAIEYPQAFHTYRINLSPFTKDFRVWGAHIET